ncbi:MAG TPA: hypothetical protein VMM12_06920 [Longimicrobiales bacterium]|nr:hypothetical protein [Longimicrobiales bacterium]
MAVSADPLPVVIHAAVSLDGRATGFAADDATLRRLAATWPDARLLPAGAPEAAALLAQGLVTEVSLLIHPVIVGEGHDSWSGGARLPAGLRLVRRSVERVEPGLAWIRFEVGDAVRPPG